MTVTPVAAGSATNHNDPDRADLAQQNPSYQGWYNTVRVMYCIVPRQYCNVMYCISNFSDKVVF